MFTTALREYTIPSLFCALLVSLMLTTSVHAQNATPDSPSATDTTTSSSEEVVVATPVTAPYPIEQLYSDPNDIPGDFVVGPGKIDLTIKPGESKTIEMIVSNRTGERKIFNLTMEDATGSQDPASAIVLLGSDRGPYSMRDYVSVPHTSFELGHNERARIPVTVTVPLDAEPGGLYGSVLVDTVALESKMGNTGGTVPQSAIIARIGTLFFITIPGDIDTSGTLKNFATVPEKKFFQESPINFGILFENTGSIHLLPYGELRIKNMFDEEVGVVQLDPWFVLPKSIRLREVSWVREFLFGRYTATIYVNRGYENAVDEMSYSFWVLPWKIMLAGFGGVFIVLFIIRAFFRSFEFKRKK